MAQNCHLPASLDTFLDNNAVLQKSKKGKSSKNDSEFIHFMDKIEDCVASLESANVDQIYVPGLVVLIESKLDVERTKELTTSLAKDKPNPEDRPKYVLDFLANEKKAAKLIRNYLPKPKKRTRRSRASRRRNSMIKERNYSQCKFYSESNKSQEKTERNFAKEGNFKSEIKIKLERNIELESHKIVKKI